ncbi:uncharacterized protein A1O9_07447 [Exophiala aquamarina CBS 119918]|uniref:Cupin type-1 domain-containing protein n=1 Tax=Exophiala aquamarina CBS 119918 TaxID=1182545 RepID=A0A072P818_9EURO|nr:uncharacterized protein A1O9_07447 [Exophiala aquamarina CBS 119918]KEF55867.1 hypothetical protein A1O9_07447 [Exophiala aquamarina CBS 119918]
MNPESYQCSPTEMVPNSRFPVLVYRDVLQKPYNEEIICSQIEQNAWIHRRTWGGIPRHHFHPNTNEVYAVCAGSSTLSLGAYPGQDATLTVKLIAGILIVLPAGVSHCSLEWSNDYRYLRFYPVDSPRWKNEHCSSPDRLVDLSAKATAVPVPTKDPFNGCRGGLLTIWGSAVSL